MVDAYELLRLLFKQYWVVVSGKEIKRYKPDVARTNARAIGAAPSS
jgi:hypothetical protein